MKFYFFICVFFLKDWLFAQDLQFMMYTDNPGMQNPALVGANHALRASVTYKDQWRNVSLPFKSFGMNLDMRFKPDNWQQVDEHRGMTFKEKTISQLAGGFSIYSDKAGIGGLNNLQTNISLAYFLPINANQFISVGFQGGLVQKKIENVDLLFPSQYNGTGYNKSISSGENFTTFYYVYPDISCGVLWGFHKANKRIPSNGITKMNMGVSLYHLTEPRQSFLNTKPLSLIRFNFHGELVYLANNSNVGVSPSFNLSQQGSSMVAMFGSYVNYYFNENSKYTGINKRSAFNFGVFYKYQSDLAFNFVYVRAEQYAMGLSYNVGFSQLNMVSHGRGGFEVLLRYTPPRAFLYEKKQTN